MTDFFGFNEPPNPPENSILFCEGLQEAVSADVAEKIQSMTDEDCQDFVREFSAIMLDWQPYISTMMEGVAENSSVSIAVGALFLAKLFPEAFNKAYIYTDKMVVASNSIQKALEE